MREQDPRGTSVGKIEKRRETMADGRRYLIYFTFEPLKDSGIAEETKKSTHEGTTASEEQGNV